MAACRSPPAGTRTLAADATPADRQKTSRPTDRRPARVTRSLITGIPSLGVETAGGYRRVHCSASAVPRDTVKRPKKFAEERSTRLFGVSVLAARLRNRNRGELNRISGLPQST